MLGIVIGVGSVVLLVGIGLGVRQDITKQIESLGSNLVFIVPGKLDRSGQPNPMSTLGLSPLTLRDLHDVATLPGVKLSLPIMFVFGSVEYGNQSFSAIVLASTTDFARIRNRPMAEGRFFRHDEEEKRVCVLAHGPKQEIFGDRQAVGQKISVRGVEFEVIGVQAPEEGSLFGPGGFSNVVYLPFAATRKALHGGQINRILVVTDYQLPPEPILGAIQKKLLANHGGKEDFALLTQKQLLSVIFKVFNIVTALLAGISAISLIVAGIGIMNIMLVTVTERTREIGIRKAVGARKKDIFMQFLTEAVVLSFLGGCVGTLVAALICSLVGAYTPLKPLITLGTVLLAFGVCFLVGIVFGVTPAMRAACQDPVEALRWE
jgi:putative ABC transport system permease protein